MSQEIAVLGGGCFWCLEAVFQEVQGVQRVVSGYAGGQVPSPTYEQVCAKNTGHAEVVKIEFDAEQISFAELLNIFFTIHDPTTPNRQGNDVGPQYRSVIFCQSAQQYQTAQAAVSEFADVFSAPIVTQIEMAVPFYTAEAYHQNYFRQHPEQGYCAVVINPKLAKFQDLCTTSIFESKC